MKNLIPVYEMTQQEWDNLSDDQKSIYPNEEANWYNTNYYLYAIHNALWRGIVLSDKVLNSLDEWSIIYLRSIGLLS